MALNPGEIIMYTTAFFGLYTSIFFLLTMFENRKNLGNPILKRHPMVTVIVPAFNEEKTLAKTVRSLQNLNYPKNSLEIMIVDDGSTDSTYKIAKMLANKDNRFPIKPFTKKNGGKGECLNFALKRARGEFVGALDADSYVHPEALNRILGHFEDQKVAAVTPSLKVYDPKTILQKIQAVEYLFGIFLRKIFGFLDSIHVTPGPFTLYRKSFFDKYGGYDEHNITEDIEIALRIHSHHYQIRNSVDALVFTQSPRKFHELLKQRIRWYRGFIDNVQNYRQVFSREHGNLGLFVLPAAFISVWLIIISAFYLIIKVIQTRIQTIKNWYGVGFDFSKMFNPRLDPFFIDQSTIMFFGIIALALGIGIILIAKKISREDTSIKTFYVMYLIGYMPLFALWWFLAFYYKIFGKKIRWAGKSL